jgi:hypothetical protein
MRICFYAAVFSLFASVGVLVLLMGTTSFTAADPLEHRYYRRICHRLRSGFNLAMLLAYPGPRDL